MGCLYVKIFENSKMYVGITNDFYIRMYHHDRNAYSKKINLPVYNAMRKYSHRTEVWADNIDDRELLNQLEIQTIKQLRESGVEIYNLTDGGEGTVGYRHKEETIQLLKQKCGGKNHRNYGKKLPEEIKLKISNSLKGDKHFGAHPMEYYETNSVMKHNFKSICNNRGWAFEDFEEVFSNQYHIKPNGKRMKKYFYIRKQQS